MNTNSGYEYEFWFAIYYFKYAMNM